MSSIIDDYVSVPRSMVKPAFVKEMASKEIKGASDSSGQTSQTTSHSTSSASSSSQNVLSTAAVASRSDEKFYALMNRVSRPVLLKGKGGKYVVGDQPIRAVLCLAATGSWINTASTPTIYSGIMTPNGCSEFADYTKLYEQYTVKRIDAQFWTGGVNAARAVSGTSVATGEPLIAAWANGPLATSPTYQQLADMQGSKLIDYLHKSVHHFKHLPKGCYIDVGGDVYENSVGWQSTSSAVDTVWGTFCWSTNTQAVTASGLTYSVVYKFDCEFRRRRYTG
jgi:hypothetical protein